MEPVEKARWFIENNFRREVSLAEVADAIAVSKFHLVRAFGARTGYSVNRYIRARRLSEAAKQLVAQPTNILRLALDFGYGSHEGFTRAFRDQFGISPEQLRKSRDLETIQLVEPIKMKEELIANLPGPKLIHRGPMLFVGLKRRYNDESCVHIPAQWHEFGPHVGHVPHQNGSATYGVLCNGDDDGNVDYVSGVEVDVIEDVPVELDSIRVPPREYAVFEHNGHVSEVRRTWATIFGKWLPESDYTMLDAPQFERYGDDFDPITGNGSIEIWVPIEK